MWYQEKTWMMFVFNRNSCYVMRDDIRTCDVTMDDAISWPNLLIWRRMISELVMSQNLMIRLELVMSWEMMPVLNVIPQVMIYLCIIIIFIFTYIHNFFINHSRQIKMQLSSRQWMRKIVVHHCLSLLLEHYDHSYRKW